MKKKLTILALLLVAYKANAYDVEINGIYYNLNSSAQTAEVTSNPNKYSGNISIPLTVKYEGNSYSVTTIGYAAFAGCSSLSSVSIPNSVIVIEQSAFYECNKLTSITIPSSVIGIEESAFYGCNKLTSITIPRSVEYIEYRAFSDCSSLTSIKVDSSNHNYDSRDNCNAIIETSSNTIISGCKNTIIPNSVTSIGSYAFYGCSTLTSIIIPNSVTSIGWNAFEDCINLKSVTINSNEIINSYDGGDGYYSMSYFFGKQVEKLVIGENITMIVPQAFTGCPNLVSIEIHPSNLIYDSRDNCNAIIETSSNMLIVGCKNTAIPNSVTSISAYAFYGCSGLASVTIPNSVISIGNYAFYGCSSLTSITIPNSVISIGNYAFYSCSSLTSITIPYSVTSIGSFAFYNCTSLPVEGGIRYADTYLVTAVDKTQSTYLIKERTRFIGESAFNGCSNLNALTIPNSVTSIGSYAFNGCSGLISIDIPNNVNNIGNCAFLNCSGLTSVTIGNSVSTISDGVFNGCSNITSVSINNNNIVSNSNLSEIFGNQVNKYIIGDDVTIMRDNLFKNYKNLASISIGKGVRSIGDDAFNGCTALANVNISDIGSWLNISFGNSMSNPLSYAHNLYLNDEIMTNLIIPDSVTSINAYAFYGCSNLSLISIGNGLKSIGADAFKGCTKLTKINISDIGSWLNISFDNYLSNPLSYAHNLYLNNEILTDLIIPDSVTNINAYAFYGCTNFTSVVIPNNVKTIGNYAFINNSNLVSTTLGKGMESIGDNAFDNCDRLRSITSLRETPPTISSTTFPRRTLQTLYVPKNCKAAYYNADYWWEFKDILELEDPIITFADANTKALCVGKWDTNGDGELSESEAAAVTSLGTTFKKSQILSFNELQYFTGITSISDGAFSKSTVGAITLPANITSLGKEAFLDCKSLTSINIPAKVQTLGQNALSGCSTMTTITVDEGNTAFSSVDGVLFSKDKTMLVQYPAAKATTYAVPESTKIIGRDAFYVSKLKTVTLLSTLEELGYDAFGYSTSLEALEIPEGVTTIGNYILDGCKNVKTLHIPSSVTTIGEYMCNGCNALTDVYCDMTTPFAIAKNNFTSTAYSNATLHVPAFAVDTYKELEGWKYFQNIVGDLASNTLTADALTINLGKSETLSVNLSNSTQIDGVQFDITLPEGLTVSTDGDDDFEVSTTDRSKKLTASCTKLINGKYRFILYSTNRAIIESGEGAIMKIKISCSDSAEPGTHDMTFSGISLSCVAGNESINQDCADFTTTVTIRKVSDIRGDANGDFVVNVTDVMEIVNNVLEKSSRTFVFANADVDHNGIINITDVMNVVNLILGYAIAPAPANAKAMPNDLLRISPTKEGCTLHTTFHTQKMTAMQMTVTLPDGCQLESATLTGEASHTHKVMARRIDDNRYNVVVFSINGTTLSVDSPILTLGITGRGGMVNVENTLCTNTDFETLLSNDINTVITDIAAIIADGDSDVPVYNTQGQRLNKPQRGVNIYEGRKVVVK